MVGGGGGGGNDAPNRLFMKGVGVCSTLSSLDLLRLRYPDLIIMLSQSVTCLLFSTLQPKSFLSFQSVVMTVAQKTLQQIIA